MCTIAYMHMIMSMHTHAHMIMNSPWRDVDDRLHVRHKKIMLSRKPCNHINTLSTIL